MRRTIIWLFAIALSVRAIVAILQVEYGIYFGVDFNQQLYGVFTPGLELYHDFYLYYGKQLSDISLGVLPYSGFAYSYPPLFLYSLYPFFKLINLQAASIPILISDAATVPAIYLIVNRFASPRTAQIAALGYAMSPFALVYEGYLWFSSQPMTLFIILSMYYFFEKKPVLSLTMLAIATMFKQEALFILPAFAIWYLKDYRKSAIKGVSIFLAFIFAVSIPFLIIAPSEYINALTYGMIGHSIPPPLYPAAISNGSTLAANNIASHALSCSSISYDSRSLICNYGNFTYTDVKSVPPLIVVFSGVFLDSISLWIAIPIFGLTSYFLFISRRKANTPLLASAFSLVLVIAIFQLTLHPIYRYYLLPAYALVLAASINRRALLVSISAPILSLFLPSGSFQLLPILFCMLSLLLINLHSQSHNIANESYLLRSAETKSLLRHLRRWSKASGTI